MSYSVRYRGGKEFSHIVLASGKSKLLLDLPGHPRSSPYEKGFKGACQNTSHTLVAFTLEDGDRQKIYLVRSTDHGLKSIRNFTRKVTALLCSRKAQRMFIDSGHTGHGSKKQIDERLVSFRDFKQTTENLAQHLWVDGFGGPDNTALSKPNDVQIRSQPDIVNRAFLDVRVSSDGKVALAAFWHEGE